MTDRLDHAHALLTAEAVSFGELRAMGHKREILVVAARPSVAPKLAALAPALKSLGFRYVTIDLSAAAVRDA